MSVPKNKRNEASTIVLNEIKNICGIMGSLLNEELLVYAKFKEIQEKEGDKKRPMTMLHVCNKQIAQKLDIVTKFILIDVDVEEQRLIEFKRDTYALQRKEFREQLIDNLNNLLLTIKASALYNRCEPINKYKINNIITLIKNVRKKIKEENVLLMETISNQNKNKPKQPQKKQVTDIDSTEKM